MSDATKRPFRLSGHAQGYLTRRGFNEREVKETIRNSPWGSVRGSRLEAMMEFENNAEWNGTYYATKRVRPILVEEPDEIVVVTVYTYFF